MIYAKAMRGRNISQIFYEAVSMFSQTNKALADIKGGIHHHEVKAHHDWCKSNGM